MQNLFNFMYFNLFTYARPQFLKYIIFLGLFFDLILYSLPLINTLLFLFLYVFNKKRKPAKSLLSFIYKGVSNLSLGFLGYFLFTENYSLFSTIWYAYLSNIFLSIILYFFHRKHLAFNEV